MKHIVKSIANKGKLKNGDNYHFFENEAVIIASVADGVGGNACDWKASEQVCGDLAYFFTNEYAALGVKEGIAHSLRKTYAKIYWTKGECEGMLSTLVSIIVDKKTNEYYFIGVGDSLILKFENEEIVELTTESEFRIQPDLLLNYVQYGGLLGDMTSFALMTDGFYTNRKGYPSELALVIQSADWENRLEQLMGLNQITQYDDMTLMLLKK